MKHENIVKIYYQDTDCYGIVWHGAYIKWFEIGRVEYSRMLGIDFDTLDQMDILLPVVELNCRYKSPARLMDEIVISTRLGDLKKLSITFDHEIRNKSSDALILTANSTIVATSKDGRLLRRMPEYLVENYTKAVSNKVLV